MTAADWARWIGYNEAEVAKALESLERLALVHRLCACDMIFYRLTGDETLQIRLAQFITWRGDWLRRAHRVEQLVGPGS
jgi:hypothetical protein